MRKSKARSIWKVTPGQYLILDASFLALCNFCRLYDVGVWSFLINTLTFGFDFFSNKNYQSSADEISLRLTEHIIVKISVKR